MWLQFTHHYVKEVCICNAHAKLLQQLTCMCAEAGILLQQNINILNKLINLTDSFIVT